MASSMSHYTPSTDGFGQRKIIRKNSIEEEIHEPRPKTLTLKVLDYEEIEIEKVKAFIKAMDQEHNVKELVRTKQICQFYEITFHEENLKNDFEKVINVQGVFLIDNKKVITVETSPLKQYIKRPITKVQISECPSELRDVQILDVLEKFGTLETQAVYHHQFKDSPMFNGIRTIIFKSITKEIPTTLFVMGNRVRAKYPGQDRTPVCSVCHTRGHYKDKCPQTAQNREPEEIQKSYSETVQSVEKMNITENIIENPTTNINDNRNSTESPITNIVENEQTTDPKTHVMSENSLSNPMQQEEDPLQDTLTQKLLEINNDQHHSFWQTIRGRGRRRSRGQFHNKGPYGLKKEAKKLKPLKHSTKFNMEDVKDITQSKSRKVMTFDTQESASDDSIASQGDLADFLSADDEGSTARGTGSDTDRADSPTTPKDD